MKITLKTLPTATEQQVFDQVANHLLTQNKKSHNGKCNCVYRSGHLKCAAGCLISDDEYEEGFEYSSWDTLVTKTQVPSIHGMLISRLQSIHDCRSVQDWKCELRNLAGVFGLKSSVLDKY